MNPSDLESAKRIVADSFNGGLAAGKKAGLLEAAVNANALAQRMIVEADAMTGEDAKVHIYAARIIAELGSKLIEAAK